LLAVVAGCSSRHHVTALHRSSNTDTAPIQTRASGTIRRSSRRPRLLRRSRVAVGRIRSGTRREVVAVTSVRLPDTVVKALKLKTGNAIQIPATGARRFEIGPDRSREQALERLFALKKPLPKGFRFNREEVNAR